MSMKTIFARQTRYVWIKADVRIWSSLSPWVRSALTAGLERVSIQRQSITEKSKVRKMPPVEIVPYRWGTADGLIDGQTNVIRAPGGFHLGVRVPAQIALCQDTQVVRAVLVHEFCHCIYYLTELVDQPVSDVPTVTIKLSQPKGFDPFNQQQDDAGLANPYDWFGEQDATSLIHHNTYVGDAIQKAIARYAGHLQLVQPDLEMNFEGELRLERSVLKRALELRARRK